MLFLSVLYLVMRKTQPTPLQRQRIQILRSEGYSLGKIQRILAKETNNNLILSKWSISRIGKRNDCQRKCGSGIPPLFDRPRKLTDAEERLLIRTVQKNGKKTRQQLINELGKAIFLSFFQTYQFPRQGSLQGSRRRD